MRRIGILLPKSTTHPEIGYDFFFGLKGSLQSKGKENFDFNTGNIGYGIDADLMFSEAERMFLEIDVDLLIVFADHPKVDKIFPLAKQFQRLIVIVNSGAKYPLHWQAADFVIFLTLEELLSARLAGINAPLELVISSGINATNFYDGGYGMSDAINQGFQESGGKIEFNFISKHLPDQFDPLPLLDFLKAKTSPAVMLSIYTGPILPFFLASVAKDVRLHYLICSAGMLNELVENEFFAEKSLPTIFGYSNINPEILQDSSNPLISHFAKTSARKVTSFTFLGWDVGILISTFSDLLFNSQKQDWKNLATEFSNSNITGSRGTLRFDSLTHHFIGDQYKIVHLQDSTSVERLASDQVFSEWKSLIKSRETPPQVGWFNTYLCS